MAQVWAAPQRRAVASLPAADLPAVKARGALRVLAVDLKEPDEFFQFTGTPGFDREILEGFAKLNELRLEPAARCTGVVVDQDGRGVAGALVEAAFAHARAAGLRVRPVCSYVRAWAQRHPRYAAYLDRASWADEIRKLEQAARGATGSESRTAEGMQKQLEALQKQLGAAEGKAEGKAEALLKIVMKRGLPITPHAALTALPRPDLRGTAGVSGRRVCYSNLSPGLNR